MTNEKKFKCFVIMPFSSPDGDSDQFNEINKAIIKSSERVLNSQVLFERADMNMVEFELSKSVHKNIEHSDFCVVDITGLNPNVLYELGFAIAKGKEVIIITQNEPPYPIDISNRIINKYEQSDTAFITQKMAIWIENAIEIINLKTRSMKDIYNVMCFQNRSVAKLDDVFINAKDKIDILQTNMEGIKRDYLASLTKALESNKGLKLRLLTIDPDSFYTQKRAEQLGIAISHHRNELHNSIQGITDALSKFGGQFSLRIYDDFPTQISFIIDSDVYICTVARNVRSRELCTFKVNKYFSGVERSFIFHFDTIWSNAHEYQAHTLNNS